MPQTRKYSVSPNFGPPTFIFLIYLLGLIQTTFVNFSLNFRTTYNVALSFIKLDLLMRFTSLLKVVYSTWSVELHCFDMYSRNIFIIGCLLSNFFWRKTISSCQSRSSENKSSVIVGTYFACNVRSLSANGIEVVLVSFVLIINRGLLINGSNIDILFEVLYVIMVREPVNVNL